MKNKNLPLATGFNYENVWAKIGKTKIWESKKQTLLGIEIDRTLNFDEYIASLFRKAGNKSSILARLSSFMCTNKKRVLMKPFVESQFRYCPLIWMFHSRSVNNKINMSDHYELSIKTILVLSKIYLKGISRLILIRGTSNH